ncbi:MAG: hypothetical protein ACOXZR_00910 [Bacilli bacterium]|jgi:hypothetical protein
MKRKLPEVFVNKINKNIKNNKTVFYSGYLPLKKETDLTLAEETDLDDIKTKIEEMFNSPYYVYKMGVKIITKNNQIEHKEIIGQVNNNLVTIDEEYISLDDIKDIEY